MPETHTVTTLEYRHVVNLEASEFTTCRYLVKEIFSPGFTTCRY